MTTRLVSGLLLSTLLLATAPIAGAHHSVAGQFDVHKTLTLSGVVSKVDWVNPHINIFVDVKNVPGNVAKDEAWKFQSNPPAWFRRVGVSRADFAKAIGQTITIEGNRAKDGSLFGYMLKVTFADGNFLELVAAQPAGNP